MRNHTKTKKQLIAELQQLRQLLAALQAGEHQDTVRAPDAAAKSGVLVDRHQLVEQHDEFLAQTIRTAKSSVCLADVAAGTFIASSQALALHGLTPETPPTHAAVLAAIHPDDRPRVEAAWQSCIEQNDAYVVEYRIVQQDGTARWIAAQGQRLPGLQGMKLWVMSQDITAQKQAEIKLRESEERFSAFMNNSPTTAWMKDEQGRYVYLNETYENYVRKQLKDCLGKTDFELWPQEIAEAFWQNDRKVLASGHAIELEEKAFDADGVSSLWLSVKFPFQDASGKQYIGGIGMNITERNQMEAALRQSEAKHRRLHEGLQDGFASVDMSGRLREWNQTFQAMVGYADEELRQLNYLDMTPRKWHAVEARIVREQVLPRGYSDVYEKEYRRKDGTVFPVELRTILIRNDAGKPTEMWALVRDITERKEAEAQLRASEHKYRSLFEAMSEGFALAEIIRDTQGKPYDYNVLEVNAAFAKLTGIPPNMAVGRTARELAPAAGADWMEALHTVALTGEPRRFQRHAAAVGKWFDVFAFCPEPGRIAALFVDITERKAAEQAIQESEWKYRSLFETIAQGVVYRNSAGEFIAANSAAQRILGLSFDEMQDRLSTDACWNVIREDGTRFSPDEFPPMRVLRTGESVENVIVGVYNPRENDYRWIVGNSIPQIRPGEETPSGVFTVFSDITELKRSQEALRHANERLEHRVEERTAALRQSEKRFRDLSDHLLTAQENERKRIANEIHDSAGQVLSAVKYRVETALQKLKTAGHAEVTAPVEELIPLIKRCIDDMRRVQMELRPSMLDEMGIVATLSWIVRQFQTTYSCMRIEQHIKIEEHEVPEGLKVIVFRIVQEALNNIGKHSDAGRVRISLSKSLKGVILQIKDNGCGFDVEEAQQIRAFGQGLGLSSMRERVQYSGGTLTIQSAPGQGTRIRAVWPKAVPSTRS